MRPSRMVGLMAIALLLSSSLAKRGLTNTVPLAVATKDGLALSLAENGTINSITIDGIDLPRPSDGPPGGGFYLGDIKGSFSALSPNLLLNPGFESWDDLADGWSAYSSGYTKGSIAHNGSFSLEASAASTSVVAGAYQVVRFNESQAHYRTLKVSGWSRAEGVSGSSDDDYAIYVDITYVDGSHLWGQTARFETGTHEWQYARKIIEVEKPVVELYVYCLFRYHVGTVWFDDIELVETSQALPPLGGELTLQGEELVESAKATNSQIELEARFQGLDRMIKVETTVSSTAGLDRALTLSYKLPLNLTGWIWGDDISSSRIIGDDGPYRNSQSLGEERWVATYPIASISNPEEHIGITIAVPMDQPRIVEFQYLPGEFSIKYDFAISGLTVNFPNKASFTFYIYKNDLPDWAFRGSLQKYYELFPQFFTKRATKEGIWMPFTPISRVRNPEDFGFMFHEGDSDVPYDNAHGYYAFVYIEPWDYWLDMGTLNREPTSAEVLSALRSDINSTDPTRRENARAVMTSGLYNSTGGLYFRTVNAPWISGSGWSALFPTNTDPSIPGNESYPNKAYVTWELQLDPAFQRAESLKATLDGIYLDSFQGYFPDTENYRKEHFSNASFPLQWDGGTYDPVLLDLFTHYPLTEQISMRMHAQGKLVMANTIDTLSTFFAHLVDVAGIEVNWLPGGQYTPDSDEIFNYRRSIMYQKPYLLLMNTNFDYMTYDIVEKYFKRCTHYAVFPSMFSADASTHPYWENSALYERDRPLFKKYIPIIEELSGAGWEPVTYARAEPSGVSLERYGPWEGTTYFSVHNPSQTEAKNFTLAIDASILSLGAEGPQIVEIIGNREVAFTKGDNALYVQDMLAPADTKVYMVRTRSYLGPSNITASPSRETITRGEPITISGLISPPPGISAVALTYTRPDGTNVLRTMNCTASGGYSDTYYPDSAGKWYVLAEWGGNERLLASASGRVQFTVEEPFPIMTVVPVIAIAAIGGLLCMRWRRSKGRMQA